MQIIKKQSARQTYVIVIIKVQNHCRKCVCKKTNHIQRADCQVGIFVKIAPNVIASYVVFVLKY